MATRRRAAHDSIVGDRLKFKMRKPPEMTTKKNVKEMRNGKDDIFL